MKSNLTTICGAVAAAAGALSQVPGLEVIKPYCIAFAAVATALLGVFAKDWNVTGGTKQQ